MALPPDQRLYMLMQPKPYLNNEGHALNSSVQLIRNAIEAGDTDPSPDYLLDCLEKEIGAEEETLARAFKLFDNKGNGALDRGDVKNMNRYLGFPAEDKDIAELMTQIDQDRSGTIKFNEFETFVGGVGGSAALFRERQSRISMKMGGEVGGDIEAMSAQLSAAGLDQEAQAYWRMVVPETEFVEAAKMVPCQQQAVSFIRRLAKKNHQEALPKLQDRIAKLGLPEDSLWLTLAWIREMAPVLVHVNLDKMLQHIEGDTHYRNQFETGTSGGLLKHDVRKKWEKDLFGGKYDSAQGKDRPKYGVQNVMNDYRGVVRCSQYGDSYMVLKDVRLRCTFSPEDSANLKADKLAVLDFYAHVLNEYSDPELKETVAVANSAEAAVLGDSDKVGKMKYKEAQIHGEVAFDRHVERLVAHTRHRNGDMSKRLEAACKKYGWKFSWMDEEQKRMKAESMETLGGAAWKKKLQELQEGGGALDVPDGFCKVGCGRKAAPGVTRANRPFTTCCRGCIMGFGHDRMCGKIDESKVGPGLCKNGCGLKISTGTDAKGRPLTTCCRGCALGMPHDASCQNDAAVVKTTSVGGFCKMACGRKVAPGTTRGGKSFDTCCAGCAKGQDHSATCIPADG